MRLPAFIPAGVLAPLRPLLDALRGIVNGGATLADNMAGEVKTIRWREVSGQPLTVSTALLTKPKAVLVLAAEAVPTTGDVASGCSVLWRWNGDTATRSISVSGITLLDSGEWDVTLWIVGG